MNSIPINKDSAVDYDSSTVLDYFQLMKPRVMSLVVFTSFVGLYLAPVYINPIIGFVTMLCITLGAGSSAAINMWYDRDIDALMKRTQKRPIIRGAIAPEEALAFGVILGFISVFLMALCVNILSSALLLFTICYYVFIYTMWLKRTSIQNIVIGGVAGAMPPIIGWAAATNDISLGGIVLFLIIFIWTPPHSWALALFCSDDYKACGVPMMPVVKGDSYTKTQICFYSVLLCIVSIAPYMIGMTSIWYLCLAVVLSVIFMCYSIMLKLEDKTYRLAKSLFVYSIFYLFAIFLGLLLFKAH